MKFTFLIQMTQVEYSLLEQVNLPVGAVASLQKNDEKSFCSILSNCKHKMQYI